MTWRDVAGWANAFATIILAPPLAAWVFVMLQVAARAPGVGP